MNGTRLIQRMQQEANNFVAQTGRPYAHRDDLLSLLRDEMPEEATHIGPYLAELWSAKPVLEDPA